MKVWGCKTRKLPTNVWVLELPTGECGKIGVVSNEARSSGKAVGFVVPGEI